MRNDVPVVPELNNTQSGQSNPILLHSISPFPSPFSLILLPNPLSPASFPLLLNSSKRTTSSYPRLSTAGRPVVRTDGRGEMRMSVGLIDVADDVEEEEEEA